MGLSQLMPNSDRHLLRRFLLDWMSPQWRLFALGGVFALVTAMAAASYTFLVKAGMDWLGTGADAVPVEMDQPFDLAAWAGERMIWILPLFVVGATIVRATALYIQTLCNNQAVQNGLVGAQDALFARLIEGDYSRLTSAASGEFVSQFINDMNVVREAALRIATNLLKGVMTVIGALAAMFIMDWALATLILIVYPIAFAPVVRIGERLRKTSKLAQEQTGKMTALLAEGFAGGRVTKAFNLEDYQKSRAHAGFVERARLYLKVLRGKAAVDPLLEIVGGLALAGVLAFTGWRVMTGAATVGDLGGFIAAIGIASPEVRALGTLNAVANEAKAAIERVYRVLDAKDIVADKSDARVLENPKGFVKFENVHFAYDGGDVVLNGLTFHAQPGETIALVGPSGAGKSTIFNLLLRLYDPTQGMIQVDGQNIQELERKSLRKSMALVSQDAFLFDDTLRANIALGRPDASEEDISAAMEAAAGDFIGTLPDGLNTRVGEGGRNLSGGQRQRVAIARAILADAPILILDEATSALDAASEARVQAALEKLSKGRTTLVIAHRLATVRNADRIFVLDKGRVVESGRHAILVAEGGIYADLVKLQFS